MQNNNKRQIDQSSTRVLHVVGGMNKGGIETWLMHVLRHIDRNRFQIDFLVHTTEPCAYDEEIRSLGSKIIPCLYPSKPWLYAQNLRKIIREYGPYDVIHSHVHYFSGYVLYLAQQLGIPVRIAHTHTNTATIDSKAGLKRQGYIALNKWWIKNCATAGLACSREAATIFFGSDWQIDPRWQVLYCGVDLSPFENDVDPNLVRAELNIPADAFVIGHVGSFREPKNHQFLLEIAAEVIKQEPRTRVLLIGDGSLRPAIEQKVKCLNLTDHVILTGVRSDVATLMRGAMDVFLFPSLYEGLPLVLIEAQAAGLPCIASDSIPKEVDVIEPLINWISLSSSASTWADVVLSKRQTVSSLMQANAVRNLKISPFNIEVSLKRLEHLYETSLYNIQTMQGAVL